ncbi:SCO7613 C-terminal domain-containing membrane protein [Streptomyces sp. NPDC014779]|uniref:SCO7613 C-terminal domain-containing membrane protein n=1 Tax=Streptomyces sp. NPDC014779 TaxID=3364911 RepID=UPI0036F8E291
MNTFLPPAEELALVDRELARLDARRAELLLRRDWLVRVLDAQRAAPALPAAGPRPWPAPGAVPGAVPPRPEATPRSTQNVLLTLGGVLLTVAALVFTLVSWGTMGIGGRAAVLVVVTSAALAAPAVLLRRGLASTAESVAALGLVLTVLDAYALHRVALPETGGLGYTAAASAVLAGLWAGYGSVLPRLRGPLPTAVAAAQLPLPLGVLAADGGLTAFAWAALGTAALDAAAVVWGKGLPVRVTAGTGAAALGGWALLTGLGLSLTAPVTALPLLLGCAAVLLFLAVRHAPSAPASAGVAGLTGIAAAGGLLRSGVPEAWIVPGYALCALLLTGAAAWHRGPWAGARPEPVALPRLRDGLALAGAGVLGLATVWALPPTVVGLLDPAVRSTAVWSGEHAERMLSGYPATAPLVLLVVTAGLAVVPRRWTRGAALALGWALVVGLPVVFGLSYGASLAVRLGATAAALAVAVRPAPPARGLDGATELLAWTGFGCGMVSGVTAVLPALDARAATFAVLGVLAALFGAVAVLGGGVRRTVAACAGVLAVAGLVGAGAVTSGASEPVTGLLLLAVPAGTGVLGAWLRRRPPAVAVEATGAAVGLFGVALTAGRPALLALGLALAGVVAAATAVRPERRPVASWAAAVLFLLASWVRLAVWGVAAPEAYTLPATVPALVVGVLRRRRDPEASSWTAYGPGLAVTLLPSLCAAWVDPHWARPLLLGLGALAVTLLGARFRLQAPLLLGGGVLALVGLHELAPYVVQAVGALPRWLPPALAGLLLLGVGATYEQRLRDARRLRERLGRMR